MLLCVGTHTEDRVSSVLQSPCSDLGREAEVMSSTFGCLPLEPRQGEDTMLINVEVGNLGYRIQSNEQRWELEKAQREYKFPGMKNV